MTLEVPCNAPETIQLEGDGRWSLRCGDLEVVVDALRGARICSFSLKGVNCLTGPEVDPNNFGSTFWTSPQSDWQWPPVEEVDSAPYRIVRDDTEAGASLSFVGSPSPTLGLSVSKRLRLLPERRALAVDYTLYNRTAASVRVAPWEISRVAGGLSFFEAGARRYAPAGVNPLPVVERDGIVWFDYQRGQIATDQKMFSHSYGNWLAHIAAGQLLIKEFESVAEDEQAPGEAAVELFASGLCDYIEIEQQGSYRELAPQASRTWRVVWLLVALPAELHVTVGNTRLVHFVREVLSASGRSIAG